LCRHERRELLESEVPICCAQYAAAQSAENFGYRANAQLPNIFIAIGESYRFASATHASLPKP
jgi:hypothetical protein